jgi:hydrogenase maturation protein HypF
VLGVCQEATYEGQAAVELEASAATADRAAPLRLSVRDADGRVLLDQGPLLRSLVDGLDGHVPVADLALGFHAGLAEAVAEAAARVRARTGVATVGLTGGVFQNALLSTLCSARLVARGFEVLEHEVVPANDGGLALGQVAVAAARGGR